MHQVLYVKAVDIWNEARANAREANVSLSTYVENALADLNSMKRATRSQIGGRVDRELQSDVSGRVSDSSKT